MLRYKLDDLGWFQFEALVQSLMKAEFGITVESWGGHSDMGRDAYARRGVVIPGSKSHGGAVVFQAKFVQGANAAGAQWEASLTKAVKNECNQIQARTKSKKWVRPDDYVLLTNCPVTSRLRGLLEATLTQAQPGLGVLVLGGVDICGLLDKHVGLRRSFPEILSLRDIDEMLREVVNRDTLARSDAALREARDLPPVFVPTAAYRKAIQLVGKHGFVVLDGPPEMGKTAIARMISLSYLANGWDIIDCRGPDDVFRMLYKGRKQLFIADDAFGRTEYDPMLGRTWERDLPRLMRVIDKDHYLILTSRKHILLRALRHMDLSGRAQDFPSPSEILVAADALTIEEKARMLYRHSRAVGLEMGRVKVVRRVAKQIVLHDAFTPERIRRFVVDVLPELVPGGAVVGDDDLVAGVAEAIRNPTDRMRKAFGRLPVEHVAVLVALVNCGQRPRVEVLTGTVVSMNEDLGGAAVSAAIDDLVGGFLRAYSYVSDGNVTEIDWIHPSYRDLVIEELADRRALRLGFLRTASLSGLKMAMAVAGGARGLRDAPLLKDEESWSVVGERCLEISTNGSEIETIELLTMLESSMSQFETRGPIGRWLRDMLGKALAAAVSRWSGIGASLGNEELRTYTRMRGMTSGPGLDLPVGDIWDAVVDGLAGAENDYDVWAMAIERVALVIEAAEVGDLALAKSEAFRKAREDVESRIWQRARIIADEGVELQDPRESGTKASGLSNIAEALALFDSDDQHSVTIAMIEDQVEAHREHSRLEVDFDQDDYDDDRTPTGTFDIDELFNDL